VRSQPTSDSWWSAGRRAPDPSNVALRDRASRRRHGADCGGSSARRRPGERARSLATELRADPQARPRASTPWPFADGRRDRARRRAQEAAAARLARLAPATRRSQVTDCYLATRGIAMLAIGSLPNQIRTRSPIVPRQGSRTPVGSHGERDTLVRHRFGRARVGRPDANRRRATDVSMARREEALALTGCAEQAPEVSFGIAELNASVGADPLVQESHVRGLVTGAAAERHRCRCDAK
jgi:hypothetical protein